MRRNLPYPYVRTVSIVDMTELTALAAAVEAKALQRARELATDVGRSIARLIVLGVAAGCLVAAGIGALLMVAFR